MVSYSGFCPHKHDYWKMCVCLECGWRNTRIHSGPTAWCWLTVYLRFDHFSGHLQRQIVIVLCNTFFLRLKPNVLSHAYSLLWFVFTVVLHRFPALPSSSLSTTASYHTWTIRKMPNLMPWWHNWNIRKSRESFVFLRHPAIPSCIPIISHPGNHNGSSHAYSLMSFWGAINTPHQPTLHFSSVGLHVSY